MATETCNTLTRCSLQWWLASLTVAWGAISVAMGFSQSQPQILAIRFLLGMFEVSGARDTATLPPLTRRICAERLVSRLRVYLLAMVHA